nr:starch-binding protein [uncultured Ruminococcus sp.]
MSKKLISIIVSCALVLSLALVGVIGVSAAIDTDGRYVPSKGVEKTHKIYFLMPESWKSVKYNAADAGAYWWNGADKCGSLDGTSVGVAWPGYKMQVENAENNLFYLDLPTDVPKIIFNNYLNGGERTVDEKTGKVTFQFGEEQFKAAKQSADVSCQYYSEGDSEYYDNLLDGEFWAKAQEAFDGNDKTFFGKFADNFFEDPEWGLSMNFNNMIYVTDPNNTSVSVTGKETYAGEFYFYYGLNEETGKYEYGSLPNYDMAKEAGLVQTLNKNATPDEPTTTTPSGDKKDDNKTDSTKNTVPTAGQNPTSSANAVSTADTANSTDNSAVQTGATTAAAVLAVLLVAGGAVLYTRKRFE